jgi:hypothetical protein
LRFQDPMHDLVCAITTIFPGIASERWAIW